MCTFSCASSPLILHFDSARAPVRNIAQLAKLKDLIDPCGMYLYGYSM